MNISMTIGRMYGVPIVIDGQTYYRTAEACQMVGTSKNTFLRWVRDGIITDVELRDRRGWRLFDKGDLRRLQAEVNRVGKPYSIAKGIKQ